MKTITLILSLIAFAIGIKANAQSDQLFDSEWTLSSFVVNSTNYYPVSGPYSGGSQIKYVPLSFTKPDNISTSVASHGSGKFTLIDEHNFTLEQFIILLGMPSNLNDQAFDNLYFSFFSSGTKIFHFDVVTLLTSQQTLQISSGNTTATYSRSNLSNSKFSNITFNVYPNPANSSIQIASDNMNLDSAEIEIFDSLGKICQRGLLNGSAVNIQHLNQGLYLIRIIKDNSIFTNKFIKN